MYEKSNRVTHSIKKNKMVRALEEIVTKSNSNILGEDVVREHCYAGEMMKKIYYYHLIDHNYSLKKKQKQTAKPPKKRNIKITELRAVYNCKACGFRTMNRESFSKHTCEQNRAQYVSCTRCDKNKVPEGYEKCTKCTYFTKNKSSLKVHMRIHAKGTPYKCTECEYSGKDLKDLIIHYNETKDLTCECGYSTHVKQQMVTHKRCHTGEKPFCCSICHYSTRDRAALQRHLKKHE